MIAPNLKGRHFSKFPRETHYLGLSTKNWKLPTQLIIFLDFGAKIIRIANPVNYSYLPCSTVDVNIRYTQPWTPILVAIRHTMDLLERLCRAGPRGRTTLGVHPLSWLLSNNRLEKVPFVSVPHKSSNRLLLSNQDKGCTPSVAHSLALPLGPALHNVWNMTWFYPMGAYILYL